MTEEIRKILEEISNDKNYSNFIDSQNGGAEDYLLLEKIKGKQLLNYITNLQKENENYKSRNEKAVEYIKTIANADKSVRSTIAKMILIDYKILLNILEGGDE